MTTENWVMIAPMLLILAIAIVLIPFLNRASVKFSKMALESSQKHSSNSEAGVSAASSQKQSSNSEVDLIAGKVSKLEGQTQRLTRAIESLSAKLDDETLEALKENASTSNRRTRSTRYTGGELTPAQDVMSGASIQEFIDKMGAMAATTSEENASTEQTEPKSRPRSKTKK